MEGTTTKNRIQTKNEDNESQKLEGDHPLVNNNNKSLSQVATPYKKTTTTKPSKRSELRPKKNNAKREITNTGCPQNRGSHPLIGGRMFSLNPY